ncbi:MAG: L-threonylcarbamoyladenylate synthase [Nanoarchaeota archaeon]
MEVLTKSELQLRFEEMAQKIKKGTIFIHPSDTIYGMGCSALDEKNVSQLRRIKGNSTPFSVWAPSLEWIKQNCVVDKKAEEWLNKLPGPYTLVLKLKNKKAVAPSVNLGKETIGVRLPNHWFHQALEELDTPIITTSANLTGKPFMTRLENLDPMIEVNADFAVYEGEKDGRPSKIINLVDGTIRER